MSGAQLVQPGYAQGYAYSPDESDAPEQYPPFMWCPALGPTGTKVREVQGRSDSGTFIGGTSWRRDGILLDTSATNGQVIIPHNPVTVPVTPFYTIELLFRVDTALANFARIYNRDGFSGPITVWYRTAGNRWRSVLGMTVNSAEPGGGVDDVVVGNTYHVVVTLDGAVDNLGLLYVNGVLVGSDAAEGNISFGVEPWEIGDRLDGTILGFALWPGVTLSARQVWERSQDFYAPLRLRRWLTVRTPAAVTGNPWYQYAQQV